MRVVKKNQPKNTITLSLLERVILSGSVLSNMGSYEYLILKKDILNKIAVTQEELKKFEIKSTEQGGLSWNEKGSKSKFEIEFSDMEKNEIKLSLKKLSDEKKLTDEMFSLYEIFAK